MAKSEPKAAAPTKRKSLKVRAVTAGFYPKDVRRRAGSVFTLTDAAHFSDASKPIVRRGKHNGFFGWMTWVDPSTPEHTVTAEEAHDAMHLASPADADVI
jgi:hypothetical protein